MGRLKTNLQSHYALSDASDSKGANTLTNVGVSFVAGKVGNCGSFNGTSDYLWIDGNPFSASRGAISCWVKADEATDGVNFTIFSYGGGTASNPGVLNISLLGDGANLSVRLAQRSDGEAQINARKTPYSLDTGVWYHLVISSSGTAWTIYINGVSQSLTDDGGDNNGNWFADTTVAETDITTIGVRKFNDVIGTYFNGLIDQVDVFDQPVVQSQVDELYNSDSGLVYADYDVGFAIESADASEVLNDNMPVVIESAAASDLLSTEQDVAVSESADADDVGVGYNVTEKAPAEGGLASEVLSATTSKFETINDAADLSDALIWGWDKNITSVLAAVDLPKVGWKKSAASSTAITDLPDWALTVQINDYIQFKETLISKWVGSETVQSDAYITDVAVLVKLVTDTITSATAITDTVTWQFHLLIQEYLSIREAVASQGTFGKTANDSVVITDATVINWLKTIASSTAITDSPNVGWLKEIIERSNISENVTSAGTLANTLSEAFSITDSIIINWLKTVTSTTSITDAHVISFYVSVTDRIALGETLTVGQVLSEAVASGINIKDAIGIVWLKVINDTTAISDAHILKFLKTIEDRLVIADLLTSVGTLGNSVESTTDLSDEATQALSFLLASTTAIVDATTVQQQIANILADAIAASDATTVAPTFKNEITETVAVSDTVISQGIFGNIVTSAVNINVFVELDGEIWECWVLNTPQFQPSIYTDFDFNSYQVHEGRAYGANSTGIHELTGETDNETEISTGLVLSATDFKSKTKKKLRKAYLGISGDSPVMVMEVEDGTRRVYTINSKGIVDASSDVVGEKWKLSYANFDTLDLITLVPVILARGR